MGDFLIELPFLSLRLLKIAFYVMFLLSKSTKDFAETPESGFIYMPDVGSNRDKALISDEELESQSSMGERLVSP